MKTLPYHENTESMPVFVFRDKASYRQWVGDVARRAFIADTTTRLHGIARVGNSIICSNDDRHVFIVPAPYLRQVE